jgi:hypothetical protein
MSNPQEKAKELIERFIQQTRNRNDNLTMSYQRAKMCALIAVDEILKNDLDFFNQLALTNKSNKTYLNSIEYWEEVKQEIEKL